MNTDIHISKHTRNMRGRNAMMNDFSVVYFYFSMVCFSMVYFCGLFWFSELTIKTCGRDAMMGHSVPYTHTHTLFSELTV